MTREPFSPHLPNQDKPTATETAGAITFLTGAGLIPISAISGILWGFGLDRFGHIATWTFTGAVAALTIGGITLVAGGRKR
ncbi:hypothetical protein [Nesterenkonia suensis]